MRDSVGESMVVIVVGELVQRTFGLHAQTRVLY